MTSHMHDWLKSYEDFNIVFFHSVKISNIILECFVRELAGDMWHVNCDLWHFTHEMWLMTWCLTDDIFSILFPKSFIKAKNATTKKQEGEQMGSKVKKKFLFPSNDATIRIGRESQCVPYKFFFEIFFISRNQYFTVKKTPFKKIFLFLPEIELHLHLWVKSHKAPFLYFNDIFFDQTI